MAVYILVAAGFGLSGSPGLVDPTPLRPWRMDSSRGGGLQLCAASLIHGGLKDAEGRLSCSQGTPRVDGRPESKRRLRPPCPSPDKVVTLRRESVPVQ